ncbi:MAG: LamG domain-containing protein [Candidatus Absconditabacteria bacterium]
MDFFLVFNNDVLSYFKQSELIYTQNFQLTNDYVRYYNQDNIGNNNGLCIKEGIIEDNDCEYLGLYGFIPPNSQLDLGTYSIINNGSLFLSVTGNNEQGIDFRIIDVSNGGEYNGTVLDDQTINNLETGSIISIKLINKNNNRNQYFLKHSNQDGLKSINIDGTSSNISASYNLKYGKNQFLQNSINSIIRFKQDMVAYYEMDQLSGESIYDFSGNGNNLYCYSSGTLHNCNEFVDGPSLDEGVKGKWLSLNGIDDYINAGPSSILDFGTGSFSISFWVKPNGVENNQTIIWDGLIDPNYMGYKISIITGGYIDFKVGDSSGMYLVDHISSNTISNSWSHVVVTFNTSGESKIYFNGLLDSVFNFATYNSSISNINNLIIGRGPVYEYYNGGIDEVRLYDTEIDYKNILNLYNRF